MAIARVKDSGNKQAGPVGFQAGSMPKVIKSQVLQHEDDSQNGSSASQWLRGLKHEEVFSRWWQGKARPG